MEKKNKDQNKDPKDTGMNEGKDQEQGYERWKNRDKNNMGNDVSSEIKIANAGGQLEGGDNKQWHMDQGDFDDEEKDDFENTHPK